MQLFRLKVRFWTSLFFMAWRRTICIVLYTFLTVTSGGGGALYSSFSCSVSPAALLLTIAMISWSLSTSSVTIGSSIDWIYLSIAKATSRASGSSFDGKLEIIVVWWSRHRFFNLIFEILICGCCFRIICLGEFLSCANSSTIILLTLSHASFNTLAKYVEFGMVTQLGK